MKKLKLGIMLGLAILASNALSAAETAPPQYTQEDLDCLYKVVYNETRGKESQGASLVVATVINRTNHSQFPDSVCGVVFQKMQFTNVNKVSIGKITPAIRTTVHKALWLYEAGELNRQVLFFHADYIYPKWASFKKRVVKIGNHIFYRM